LGAFIAKDSGLFDFRLMEKLPLPVLLDMILMGYQLAFNSKPNGEMESPSSFNPYQQAPS
jgi:hypothetical protein